MTWFFISPARSHCSLFKMANIIGLSYFISEGCIMTFPYGRADDLIRASGRAELLPLTAQTRNLALNNVAAFEVLRRLHTEPHAGRRAG